MGEASENWSDSEVKVLFVIYSEHKIPSQMNGTLMGWCLMSQSLADSEDAESVERRSRC